MLIESISLNIDVNWIKFLETIHVRMMIYTNTKCALNCGGCGFVTGLFLGSMMQGYITPNATEQWYILSDKAPFILTRFKRQSCMVGRSVCDRLKYLQPRPGESFPRRERPSTIVWRSSTSFTFWVRAKIRSCFTGLAQNFPGVLLTPMI